MLEPFLVSLEETALVDGLQGDCENVADENQRSLDMNYPSILIIHKHSRAFSCGYYFKMYSRTQPKRT
jgi:hypothetical protein